MTKPNQELKQAAFEVGLDNLKERHWNELKSALDSKKRLTEGMPNDLTIWDEPAHIYRAGKKA